MGDYAVGVKVEFLLWVPLCALVPQQNVLLAMLVSLGFILQHRFHVLANPAALNIH